MEKDNQSSSYSIYCDSDPIDIIWCSVNTNNANNVSIDHSTSIDLITS